ncbi:MAG: endonuclease/exonuclease/phosphatase family protein [Candidatus Methylumidiphilus sp.]
MHHETPVDAAGGGRLRLASFNIQTGINTAAYHEYVTGGWRHVFPSSRRIGNLDRIAKLLAPFDLVGLQEVDGGGARSHFIVQTEYLAQHGGFPHWHNQINRRFGNIALHSNGMLSRFQPSAVADYPLPGMPGRGALLARFGQRPETALHLCVMHLALSRRARLKQLAFIVEIIQHLPHVVLMGDLNCAHDSEEIRLLTRTTALCDPFCVVKTFPSWRPKIMLDHILVTPAIQVDKLWALNFPCSDHLPIAMEVTLPAGLGLAENAISPRSA